MLALDLSNYDGELPDSAVAAFKAAGVTAAIVGCQDEGIARQQVAALGRNGVRVLATYAFLYFGFDGFMGFQDLITMETQKAIRVAQSNGIGWVALDVEANGVNELSTDTPPSRIADLRKAIAQVEAAGLRVLIYTGGWYWPSYMANTTAFSGYPLWHSEYPNDGHAVQTVAYGGWSDVAIHQYTSSFDVAGRKRDANYVFSPLFTENDMTLAEVQTIVDAATAPLKTQLDRLNEVLVQRLALIHKATDPDASTLG